MKPKLNDSKTNMIDSQEIQQVQQVFQDATYEDAAKASYQAHTGVMAMLNYTAEEVKALYDAMTDTEKNEFEKLILNSPPKALMKHQVIPEPFAKKRWWEIFLLIGGRGVAKTTTGAFACREHLRHYGKKARIIVGAPTVAQCRDVCAEGETGLITMFKNEFPKWNRSMGEARHVLGGLVKFMGTEKPGAWNGPQSTMLWIDEVALCNRKSVDDGMMGLRIPGPNNEDPYAVMTTTPKNNKYVKDLAFQPTTYVPQYIDSTTGKWRIPTTFDNPYLPSRRVEWLKNKYLGSRMGRQELLGMFIDDVPGAKIQREWIDNNRETDSKKWPRMSRIIVAVDPAGSVARKTADENALSEDQRQNQEKNADTGLAVVGLGIDGKFYVLALMSGQWTPNEWGAKALKLFYMFRADKIVAESNFGGLMVESNIRNIDSYDEKLKRRLVGRYVPIKLVTASRGKHIRLEPVATLYEQNKVIHTSHFGPGEDQMCAFVDADTNEGADMLDALVWSILELSGLIDQANSKAIITIPGDGQVSRFLQTVR